MNVKRFSIQSIFNFLILFTILLFQSCQQKEAVLPYLDSSLSFEERVDDLVGRMTLEEKVSQMLNGAPAIERLGIPEYNW